MALSLVRTKRAWRVMFVALGAMLLAAPALAANVAHGQSLYTTICATCHNPGTSPGPELAKLGANNPEVIRIALNTVPEMTDFESLLSPADIDDLAAYLGVRFNIPPPSPPPPLPPPPPVAATADAIEYFHATFDHYFITTIGDEITKLDNGTFAGWARTGRQFKVFAATGTGLSSVCRFFSTAFAPKSSHFYTASSTECTTVKANANWTFEGEVFFVATPAIDGTCAGGTVPVYRLYNNGQGAAPNHRFTTDLTLRSQMIARGWIAEGQGIGVTMCAPP